MSRWWYTEQEWSKYIGWGKLPKEYAKPTHIKDVKFGYQDENHPQESWDQFLVRKETEDRHEKSGDAILDWYNQLVEMLKRDLKK